MRGIYLRIAREVGIVALLRLPANGTSAPLPPVSLWALTVLAGGAVVKAPLDTSDTGLLPNRNLVLWSYNSIKDPRLTVDDDCVTVTFDSS